MLFELLIPTMPARQVLLARLFDRLLPQLAGHPSVGYFTDDGPGTIGAKRQRMMENSKANYIAFIDDDDMISEDYIERILPLLVSSPDCVGLIVHVTMDGVPWSPSPLFQHSLQWRANESWSGNTRTPHHLCPLRRDLALRSRFPDKSWGEDYSFALGVLPHLQREEWAGDDPLYFYDYRSGKPTDPAFSTI
jgi:glycosyltransferase involved in cell wall biosynthesis